MYCRTTELKYSTRSNTATLVLICGNRKFGIPQEFCRVHKLKAKQKSPSCFFYASPREVYEAIFFLLDITTTHNKKGKTLSETFLTLSSAYISFLFPSSHPDPPLREITELSKEKACSIRPFTDHFSTDNDQFRRCAELSDSSQRCLEKVLPP